MKGNDIVQKKNAGNNSYLQVNKVIHQAPIRCVGLGQQTIPQKWTYCAFPVNRSISIYIKLYECIEEKVRAYFGQLTENATSCRRLLGEVYPSNHIVVGVVCGATSPPGLSSAIAVMPPGGCA